MQLYCNLKQVEHWRKHFPQAVRNMEHKRHTVNLHPERSSWNQLYRHPTGPAGTTTFSDQGFWERTRETFFKITSSAPFKFLHHWTALKINLVKNMLFRPESCQRLFGLRKGWKLARKDFMQLFEEHPKLSRYVVFSFWCAWLCVWTHAETHERFTRVLTSSGWIHFAAQMMQRSRGIFHYPPRSTPLWRCTSSSQQCEPTAGPWARGGKNYWTLDVEGLNDNAPVGTQYGTKRLEGCSTLTLHRWSSAGHAADGRWGVREAGRLSKGWRRDMSQLAITTSVITWNMLHVNAKPLSKTDRSHTACLYCLDCHT